MQVTNASTWEEFSPWLDQLESERTRLAGSKQLHVSELLFRGQANAKWPLATTLERQYPSALLAKRYYLAASSAKPQIEAHTGLTWDIPEPPEYDEWIDRERMYGAGQMQALEYLAYLRHHGFPSPLLDWTQSPFVAAYFALSGASASTERVAIYAYVEYAGSAKGGSSSSPTIWTIGPYLRTHRRHFLQQSQYTLCTVKIDGAWHYANHTSAFGAFGDDPQDLLWCFTLPSGERTRGLRYLDKFNLNAFSLLGSEESLMETVAFRVLMGRE
jgi:hypothetical protein